MSEIKPEQPKIAIAIGETGLPSLGGSDSGESTGTGTTETISVGEPSEVATPEHASLIVVKGLDAGRVIALGRAEVTIGRARDCFLTLPDRGVSAHHARLTPVNPDSVEDPTRFRHAHFLLEDLDSKNGTLVAGSPLTEPRRIRFGESFQVGPDVVLRLVAMTAAEDQAARQLYSSSMRDGLTNVFNRRYFAQRLHAELAYSARRSTPFSVVVVNMDNFKRINDEHGHAVGDAVLKNFVRILQRELRAEDVLARVESQDFAILLREMDEKGAIACAERLRTTLAKEEMPTPDNSVMTLSAGIATSVQKSENLLDLAMSRLRMAKALGRDQLSWA